MKFWLASMKTSCSESTHKTSIQAFLCSYWCFILVYIHNRLSEQFSESQAVSEQLLQAQAAIRKPEQAL
jgi:hypothetical protein